ncbi:MAG: 4Fe-4S dicluster domain-containing protein [Lentisphaerae bacterium]|nr:4Fe-4S dicluster domain-containing protein [Lentisphaerota bacterium]
MPRRDFLKAAAGTLATLALSGCTKEAIEAFLQKHFQELSPEELKTVVARLERECQEKQGVKVSISTKAAAPGVLFGAGLDLSRCIGCRRCVYGCVKENNLSRNHQIQWIRVLEQEKAKGVNLEDANPYYDPKEVPREGYFYIPVSCQHCRRPPCVKVCPVKATWSEPDGIVVVDYNWCIGCRCCMSACPYGARHFNWGTPSVPSKHLNPRMHYFGNRPRPRGVVEKCTFCIQRTREGRYPACVEACPVGARKFGNLLDRKSEIRQIMERKRVFVLKAELNTQPTFYYFYSL